MTPDGVDISLLSHTFRGYDPLFGGDEDIVQKDLFQSGAAVLGKDAVGVTYVLGKERIALFHNAIKLYEQIADQADRGRVSGERQIVPPGADFYGGQSFQLTQVFIVLSEKVTELRAVGKVETLGLQLLVFYFQSFFHELWETGFPEGLISPNRSGRITQS